MRNRQELKRARTKAIEADWTLQAIEDLPRRRGQQVRWRNGVVWERVGDDQWRPWHFDKDTGAYTSNDEVYGIFPSDHVATSAGNWNPVEPVSIRLNSERTERE